MRIAIMGMGKMGSWLARELARENVVAAFDRDAEKAAGLSGVQPLEQLSDLSEFSPKLLINIVSLENTIPAFLAAQAYLPESCMLCDVASVKGRLPEYYAKCGFRFVSVHPMFGPTYADINSLALENAVIIKESDGVGARLFRSFFAARGLRIYDFSFAEHDAMMAYSLTTPFVTSLVFAACLDNTAVPGTTFFRHRELARRLLSEDDSLLCEVLFNLQSLPQLERITARLEELQNIIRERNHDQAKGFLERMRRNVG